MSCPACGADPDRLRALVAEAEAPSARPDSSPSPERLDWLRAQAHAAKAEHQATAEYAERSLAEADARGNLGLRVPGLLLLGHALTALGRYAEALRHVRALLAMLDGDRARERFGLAGFPYTGACVVGATALVELGDEASALTLIGQGRAVALGVGDCPGLHALTAAEGDVLTAAGRPDQAIPRLEASARTGRDDGAPGALIAVLTVLGRAYVEVGRAADAITAAEDALALEGRLGLPVHRSDQHTVLARAWLALEDLERADAALTTALARTTERGERGHEAWARLVGATLALHRGDRRGVERWADDAQDIAEELGMMTLVARCRAVQRRSPLTPPTAR